MLSPAPLREGDKVAIISPASIVKREYIDGAADFLRHHGLCPVLSPHVSGPESGSYSSSLANRTNDLLSALADPEIRAILCARGGYGCVHLLPSLRKKQIRDAAKWLIGFSDVTALHAIWQSAGVMSIHGPMAKHLTLHPDDESSRSLLYLLFNADRMHYVFEGSPLNREGKSEGVLRGGNFAVFNNLAGTDCDPLTGANNEATILFIEDISEAIYEVERMLMRMYLGGILQRLKGIMIGNFTDYKADRNHSSMEEMIDGLLMRLGIDNIPVAFGVPVGHSDVNYPLVMGDTVSLEVSKEKVILQSEIL